MAAAVLGLFSFLLVLSLLFQRGSLLSSPIDASHEELKAANPNGLFSKPGEFPYQVYMYVVHEKVCNETKCYFMGSECGGAIANEYYVLTASHCIKGQKGIVKAGNVMISVGVENTKHEVPKEQTYMASEVHMNPKYKGLEDHFQNDIAIIKLAKPIRFTDNVRPACFNFKNQTYDYLIASGYGTTSPQFLDKEGHQIGTQKMGDRLKYAFFKEFRDQDTDCDGDDNFICINSYFKDSHDSVCMGDSGGPLSTPPDSNGEMQVIGVTSNVMAIDLPNEITEFCTGPSKYTRLGKQADFIDSVIGKDNYCSIRD